MYTHVLLDLHWVLWNFWLPHYSCLTGAADWDPTKRRPNGKSLLWLLCQTPTSKLFQILENVLPITCFLKGNFLPLLGTEESKARQKPKQTPSCSQPKHNPSKTTPPPIKLPQSKLDGQTLVQSVGPTSLDHSLTWHTQHTKTTTHETLE